MSKLHEGEVDVDEDIVRRLLGAQFPQFSDEQISRVHSAGTVNYVFRIGSAYYARLPRLASYARDLQKEIEWLPVLSKQLTLEVPTPVWQGDPSVDYPYAWAIYRWLPGASLDLTRAGPKPELLGPLTQFIEALRACSIEGAPQSTRDAPMAARDKYARNALHDLATWMDAGPATEAWQACLDSRIWEGAPVWTHGDLLPPNLLVTRGRLSAVLDFGNMGAGDPAVDVIAAWSLLDRHTRDEFRTKLDIPDDVWDRSRGFALFQALMGIPYYWESNPEFTRMAMRTYREILDDIGIAN